MSDIDLLHVCNKANKIKSFTISKKDVDVWHTRLGYPNNKILMHVLNSMNYAISSNCTMSFYHAYQLGNLNQTTFPWSISQTNKSLELIYSNLWEPSPISTHEGYKYYVHFINDFSRFT